MLELCPITLREANAFVERHHRHHKPVTGCKFAVACSDGGGDRWSGIGRQTSQQTS